MVLIDFNVLVYAHRRDSLSHIACRHWLENCIDSEEAYGMSDLVLSAFLRIVTHPRIFKSPSRLEEALRFAYEVRSPANCVLITPGARHGDIFTRLCREAGVKGNLVLDAYLAALAIESGSEWITTDRDYARFPGLRWRPPQLSAKQLR